MSKPSIRDGIRKVRRRIDADPGWNESRVLLRAGDILDRAEKDRRYGDALRALELISRVLGLLVERRLEAQVHTEDTSEDLGAKLSALSARLIPGEAPPPLQPPSPSSLEAEAQ